MVHSSFWAIWSVGWKETHVAPDIRYILSAAHTFLVKTIWPLQEINWKPQSTSSNLISFHLFVFHHKLQTQKKQIPTMTWRYQPTHLYHPPRWTCPHSQWMWWSTSAFSRLWSASVVCQHPRLNVSWGCHLLSWHSLLKVQARSYNQRELQVVRYRKVSRLVGIRVGRDVIWMSTDG